MNMRIHRTVDPSGYYPYSSGEKWAKNSYLFTHEETSFVGLSIISNQGRPGIIIVNSILRISEFRIHKYQMDYINPYPIMIDLRTLRPGKYRIIAVHNFKVEDKNPDLFVGICGIFLSGKQNDTEWDKPEYLPFECRTLEILGIIDAKKSKLEIL